MDSFNTQISVNITRNRENKSMKYSISPTRSGGNCGVGCGDIPDLDLP